MSFDLGVFYTEKPHTNEEAFKRYVAFCEEDDLSPYIEGSTKISAFIRELTEQYSQIDDWPEDDLDDCPWSIAFDMSDGHVLMPMVWSYAEKMYPIIIDLAEKHGLVCVDPQSEAIVTAPEGIFNPGKPWWMFW